MVPAHQPTDHGLSSACRDHPLPIFYDLFTKAERRERPSSLRGEKNGVVTRPKWEHDVCTRQKADTPVLFRGALPAASSHRPGLRSAGAGLPSPSPLGPV